MDALVQQDGVGEGERKKGKKEKRKKNEKSEKKEKWKIQTIIFIMDN